MKKPAPATVEAYLAGVPQPMREALETLRARIRALAPEATEVVSYQMPTFKLKGGLVAFAAFTDHCSFFPMSHEVLDAHAELVAPYRTSKGTLQFTPEQPLPDDVVATLVRARIAENDARSRARTKAKVRKGRRA